MGETFGAETLRSDLKDKTVRKQNKMSNTGNFANLGKLGKNNT